MKEHRVVIVGAGASGLSLAIELGRLHREDSSEKKLNMTLLEASSVVGGRVRTIRTTSHNEISPSKFLSLTPSHQEYWKKRYEKFKPWTIPLGAEFVHGNENNHTIMDRITRRQRQEPQLQAQDSLENPKVHDWDMDLIVDFAEKRPNLTVVTDDNFFHWYDGSATNEEDLNDTAWPGYIDKAKHIWDELLALDGGDQYMTLKQYVNNKYNNLECDKAEEQCVLSILSAVYATTAGTTPDLLAVKELSRQENLWPYGEKNFRLGRCYSELIDELLMELESLAHCPDITVDIVSAAPVKEISMDSQFKCVKVVSCNQFCYECDCVGVTAPLAMLKSDFLHFNKGCALTDEKQQAIESINVLPGGKVHALLKWDVDLKKPRLIDYTSLQGIFICPNEQFKQVSFRWNDTSILATGFCVFREETHDEKEYIHLKESFKMLIIRILHRTVSPDIFFKDQNSNICLTFSAYDIYDWSKDQYIRGMYSSPSVNSGHILGDIPPAQYLAEPISKVHFAGEHTHTETSATVQSALESGIRVAHEIYQHLIK